MKNFVQPGNNITIPAPYDVDSGDGAKSGLLFGVAFGAADTGEDLDLATTGVFDLAKVGANTFDIGAAVYWDDTAKLATSTAASNTKIGVATEPAANPSATVRVRLNGTF